jgi:hypothetical protein
MTSDAPRCPGCGDVMTRVTDHGVRCACSGCSGRLLGLRPFEQLLQEGVGARLWMASEAGEPAGVCPFCGQALRAPPASAGGPDGLAMCRVCQQVWVPGPAQSWIAAHASAPADGGPVPLAVQPTRCEECGAPWQPDDMGRCRYCHVQLTAPAPVVVFETPPAPTPASDLLGAVARLVTGPDQSGW